MLMRRFFLFLIFSSSLLSQTVPSGMISGSVRDVDTGNPLYYVNVFLANTTLGTASDENGYYRIENIPPGKYELVFSHIGYEVHIIPIDIFMIELVIKGMDVRLKSKVLEGEEVAIETEKPREWIRDLERFTRIFIGETDNAKKCTILNPEVIDIHVDPETNIITASSENMIKVENRALGYEVEIVLVGFEWERFDLGSRYPGMFDYGQYTDEGSYTIYAYFKEMEPENDKEYQEWLDKRYKTYRGSLPHFLSSLVLDCVEDNKFRLYKPTERGSTHRIQSNSIGFTLIDSARYIKRIYYDGFLHVQYGALDTYTSILQFQDYTVDVDSFGYNLTPYSLNIIAGYWSTLRVADTLPRSYRPSK
ncbi:carboxypeptidase-like regulatory domain-containing protein [bacterium]|nr:carboxypeptidase-like regulatory domain-containing protein [bacterium]